MPACSLLLFINRAYISKSCTDWPDGVDFKWAGLQAAVLLDRAEWVAPLYWLLPTSKIPLLPWLQGELPKSVSVYLVALMELLASLMLSWKETPPPPPPPRPPPHRRRGRSGAVLRSLSTDACKWAHMAPRHIQHRGEDEMDHRGCDHEWWNSTAHPGWGATQAH